MATFRDLGIDLDLFAGPVDDAAAWAPQGRCALCGDERAGFTLGIGDDVVVRCEACGADTPVPVDDGEDGCRSCGATASLPEPLDGDHGCWRCLQRERWAVTMETEEGMVRWGDPATATADLAPLARTPRYVSWQGERWLLHCAGPMRYLGRWGRAQFDAAAAGEGDGDGRALALEVADLGDDEWEHGLSEQPSDDSALTVYVFRCPTCATLRGHWDLP